MHMAGFPGFNRILREVQDPPQRRMLMSVQIILFICGKKVSQKDGERLNQDSTASELEDRLETRPLILGFPRRNLSRILPTLEVWGFTREKEEPG